MPFDIKDKRDRRLRDAVAAPRSLSNRKAPVEISPPKIEKEKEAMTKVQMRAMKSFSSHEGNFRHRAGGEFYTTERIAQMYEKAGLAVRIAETTTRKVDVKEPHKPSDTKVVAPAETKPARAAQKKTSGTIARKKPAAKKKRSPKS